MFLTPSGTHNPEPSLRARPGRGAFLTKRCASVLASSLPPQLISWNKAVACGSLSRYHSPHCSSCCCFCCGQDLWAFTPTSGFFLPWPCPQQSLAGVCGWCSGRVCGGPEQWKGLQPVRGCGLVRGRQRACIVCSR